MLDSLKAPFTLPIQAHPRTVRTGAMVMKAGAIVTIFAMAAMVVYSVRGLLFVQDAPFGGEATMTTIIAIQLVMALVVGLLFWSMFGTTLLAWEARTRQGVRYARWLAGILLFVGISNGWSITGALLDGVQDPATWVAAGIALAALLGGASLLWASLHPASREAFA